VVDRKSNGFWLVKGLIPL